MSSTATTASIFCDGACSGNGTRHARAGWAWAYWPGPARGEPDHHDRGKPIGAATNQRAELQALLEGLRWWKGLGGGPVTIYTDSMYTINCTTVWGPSWRRKGWKRDSGEPLQNLDLVQPLVELWGSTAQNQGWRLQHVRGHQSGHGPEVWGNNWVDAAAVLAASDCVRRDAAAVMAASGGEMVAPRTNSIVQMIQHTSREESVSGSNSIVRMIQQPPRQQSQEEPVSNNGGPPKTNSILRPTRVGGQSGQTDIRRWFGGGDD
jgi:ribonuclease HI